MIFKIIKRKQFLSFLPLKVKIGKSNYEKVLARRFINFDARKEHNILTVIFLGMKKEFDIKQPEAETDSQIELFFYFEKTQSIVILFAFLCCLYLIGANVLTEEYNGRLVGSSLVFLTILFLGIFNSLCIRKID
jgi:hypothetical protein